MASESQGIDVARTKLWVYVVAASGCGLAGALYFLGNLRISPDAAFSVNWTAFSIFIVMVGGMAIRFPRGLWGYFGIELFPIRRRLRRP